MSIYLYPSYPPYQGSKKIHNLWKNCFNINGKLKGLDATLVSNDIIISSGAFFSNGCTCILNSDQTISNIDYFEPYYIYGLFNNLDGTHIVGVSKDILTGYAPIAKKIDGTLFNLDLISFDEIRNEVINHLNDSSRHISEDQYLALHNSFHPSALNVFSTEDDNSSGIIINPEDLKIYNYSRMNNFHLNLVVPYSDFDNILFDNINNRVSKFIDNGINDTIDVNNSTAIAANNGYMDNPKGRILIDTSMHSDFEYGRCDTSVSSQYNGIKSNHLRVFKITKGDKPAHLEWFNSDGSCFNADSNFLYTNIKIPDDDNIKYIKLVVYDSVYNKSESIKYINELNKNDWNILIVNISSLNKNEIKYVRVDIGYSYECESQMFYIDSICESSFIQTNTLIDDSTSIKSIRLSDLSFYDSGYQDPIIDLSINDGTNYFSGVLKNHNLNIEDLGTYSTYKLKLRINLFNSGGNYSIVKANWPDNRKNESITIDKNSNTLLMSGGIYNNNYRDSILYILKNDISISSPSNINNRSEGSGSCVLDNKININGGQETFVATLNNKIVNWSNNSSINLTNIPTRMHEHGCVQSEDYKMIIWQGKFLTDFNKTYEFSIKTNSWISLQDSAYYGQTVGEFIDNYLIAAGGDPLNPNGIKYNKQYNSWFVLALNNFRHYSTCASLNSKDIIYESENNLTLIQIYLDIRSMTEKNIQCPTTGPGTSDADAYFNDFISLGPWESNGSYYNIHNLYIPYKIPILNGFSLKYRM